MTETDSAQIMLESSYPYVSVKDVWLNKLSCVSHIICGFFVWESEPCRQIGWLPIAKHRCLVALNSVLYGSMAVPVSRWEHWHASRRKWALSFFLPSTIILAVSPSQPYSFHPCTHTHLQRNGTEQLEKCCKAVQWKSITNLIMFFWWSFNGQRSLITVKRSNLCHHNNFHKSVLVSSVLCKTLFTCTVAITLEEEYWQLHKQWKVCWSNAALVALYTVFLHGQLTETRLQLQSHFNTYHTAVCVSLDWRLANQAFRCHPIWDAVQALNKLALPTMFHVCRYIFSLQLWDGYSTSRRQRHVVLLFF